MDLSLFFQLLWPGLTTGCVYALVALGYVLCANVSGVVNFAQGEFVMLGGVLAGWLVMAGVPFIPAIALATLAGAALGTAQEVLTLAPVRHRPAFIQITTTVGVSVVIRGTTLIAFGKDPLSLPGFSGDGVFILFGAVLPVQTLWVWGATLALLLATYAFLRFTDTGCAVRACSINLQAARLMGVRAERLRVLVFAASGATGGARRRGDHADRALQLGCRHQLRPEGLPRRHPRRVSLGEYGGAGGLGIGLIESFGAGYISSGWKDFIVYGALLGYLLLRGGVFLRGRSSPAAAGH